MMRSRLKLKWPVLCRVVWRYWRHKESVKQFRERRRKAGQCYDCKEPRQAHTLRCGPCGQRLAAANKARELDGAAAQLPAFWQKHPELIEHNDRVLQGAWEADHG